MKKETGIMGEWVIESIGSPPWRGWGWVKIGLKGLKDNGTTTDLN